MIVRSPDPDVVIPDTPFAPYVLRQAERLAGKLALIDGASGRAYTYGEVAAIVRRLAAGLSSRGFRKGDVLALFSPNCPEYPMVFLAAALLGGATTTINPTYTVDELAYQLNDAGARYLVADPVVLEKALEGKRRSRVEEVFVLGQPLSAGGAGGATASGRSGGGGSLLSRWFRRLGANRQSTPTAASACGATPLVALLANNGVLPPVAIDVADDVVALPYSSGTTGLAKGVMLTHRNLVANLCQMEPSGLVTDRDVVIGVLPFYHIYGLTVILAQSLANGATIVSLPRFDLAQFLQTLQERRVTVGFMAPPIMLALAKQPLVDDYDLSHLRIAMSAAAPLAREVEETVARRLGCLVVQGWGLTETSPDVTLSPIDAARLRLGSVGCCIPNSECKVVDVATGAELGPNQQGEIWARGPQIMKGYLNNPAATADMLDGEGWLHTGDIGYFDEDGCLFIVDRLKELIKYKGYQVAPAELEGLLLTHPAVADAAVIPCRDEEAGEVPKAFVALKPGAMADADELMAYVAERVAPYKRIRRLQFVEQVPKSPSGKILRRVLVERERAD
ncbi:MAG TPA: 4-coumarate--CoA ligase family protein [Ktedonobacterales bacterium]|nr:4-coumarate--CoA ligase family protein [Ktedonobacterales bacterium]